jgi:HAD superfamily hydrolase (TIGR01509 family)
MDARLRTGEPKLMSGARRIVETLARDFDLAIVTCGNRTRVRQQLREFELTMYFGACVCSEDASRKKPHPAPLRLALEQLRADPSESVYVGDTQEDVEMARRADVRPIGVLGPFPTAQRIRAARPDVLLHSIRELPPFLRALD